MKVSAELADYLEHFNFNLYELNECVILIESIAKYSSELNQTSHSLYFGSIQSILYSHAILNLSKLFDKPHPRHPTVSIPSIISILKSPNLHTQDNLQKCMLKIKEYGIAIPENDIQPIELLITHFTHRVEEKAEILDRVRINRDKAIAHNEIIDFEQLYSITWGELNDLKTLAEEFSKCVGYCFCGKSDSKPFTDLGSLRMSTNTLMETVLTTKTD